MPLRARLLGVALLVGVVVTSAVVLERGVAAPDGARAVARRAATGAWFCPHGGSPRWRGWVVVTNPGPSQALVRVTSFGRNGARHVESLPVPPFRQVYRAIPEADASSATEVEYFGGWVAAATVLRSGGRARATAASRCVDAQSRTWFIPDAAAGSDESAYVVLMNPFAQDAQLEVSIRTERRAIKPGPLTPYVLAARTSVAIPLREFVLQAPSERTTSVQIETTMGRAIAGVVSASEAGIWAEAGMPRAARAFVLPAPNDAEASELATLNPGPRRADVEVLLEAGSGEPGRTEAALAPGQVATYSLRGREGAGGVVRSSRAIVVARNATGPEGDAAMITGTSRPWRRWLVLPTMPPRGGRSVVLLQNPDRAPATVRLRVIGPDGEALPDAPFWVGVPPETTVAWRFPEQAKGPLSAVISSYGVSIVAAGASISLGGEGYSATMGVPIVDG